MKPTKKRERMMPDEEMSTTRAMTSDAAVTRSLRPIARPERPRPMPYDEMSTTGAMTESPNPVERSLRPIARPDRPAKKFADGGMVRGCKPGQSSGTKFSGTF